MSQKSSVPQAASFVSVVLKRDSLAGVQDLARWTLRVLEVDRAGPPNVIRSEWMSR